MFLGLGMSEIAVVALLALLIIGPKDLPVMLRTLGNGWKQLMQLRREFMRTVNAFMRENDLDEVRNAAKAVQQFRPPSAADFLDPDRSLRKDLADIDQDVKAATEPNPRLTRRPTLLVVRKALPRPQRVSARAQQPQRHHQRHLQRLPPRPAQKAQTTGLPVQLPAQ